MKTIKNMPHYSAYKDSGVDGLGEIPINWKIIKLKYLVKVFNGDSLSPEKKELFSQDDIRGRPYVSSKDIDLDTSMIDYNNGVIIPYSLKNYKIAPKNSILLCIEGGSAGKKVAYTDRQVSFVNKLACFHSNKVSNKFLYYSLKSKGFQYQFSLSLSGLIGGVAISAINNFFITVPILETQNRIVQFLDKNISQIEQAIAIKEKQIKLIKERQKILIHKVVTQGMNPNVPMKDSGIEWIGQVPSHWLIKRAKYLFNEIDERSKTGNEELLSVSHMTGVTPRSEKNVNMFMAEDYTGSKLCTKNDLVINIMWAWMGALGVSDRIGIVSPSYGVYRQKTNNTFHPCYLEYLLKSDKYIEYYNRFSTGLHSSRLRFYGHMLFAMKIGYPDFKEQNDIINYLNNEIKKFEHAVQLYQQQIEKLKEYKATLIDSAVTGKIKITTEE